jgi:protoporphyrinogen/coproporphyrinogen III oxidase
VSGPSSNANRAAVRVVVVGGGIAGLAAAHRLAELGGERGTAVAVTLLEARPRLGGTIATEQVDGYLVEAGPDAFLTERPWALDLCARLGLTDRLIRTQEAHRRTFVVYRGRLHPLPDGFGLLAPSRLGPVLRSPLFSWRGKARMMMDLLLPRGSRGGDESLGAFVRRRLGSEVLDRVAQPMVAGIYTADPETLSLAATMPRFLEMERTHRSLIRALRRARARTPGAEDRKGEGDTGPRWSLFVAPAEGMGALVAALAARLPAAGLRLGRRAVSLERARRSPGGGVYRIGLDDGSVLAADGVILAQEAPGAARLVAGVDPDLSALLQAIPYASSATVTLGYRREDISHSLDGFGFVVPETEERPVLACTFSSVKFAGRAPRNGVLLRAFLGGALHPGVLDRDDSALSALAAGEVRAVLGATAAPHLVRVHRHPGAMPQYALGHLDRLRAIEARAARHAGLALAGAGYRGVGIPDCIRSGEEAAERVLAACGEDASARGAHAAEVMPARGGTSSAD